MLLGHLGDASVGCNDEQAIVWIQRSKAMHGRLEILLVAAHVKQVHDLSGGAHNVGPDLVLLVGVRHLGNILLAISIETNNFVCYRRRSAVALLVLEIEYP